MADATTVGQRLRMARIAAGYTRRSHAANALGISDAMMRGYEEGSIAMPCYLVSLAWITFRVRFEWLMDSDGPMRDGGEV